ncbi:MAG TPA: phosphatidate cytidylyltransferase [Bacteroidia bacterium]|jgi:phytol kinase|nr:phosphatidate cytidylyltransferase [Bacteroidia bacterium]
MNTDIRHSMGLTLSFLALFAVAEVLRKKFNTRVEITRKLVHLGTGFISLLFPLILSNHWYVLALCAGFALLLNLSLKLHILQSVNAIERDSVGSITYPVSVYGCFLAYDYFDHQYNYFYLPILILAICDPVAALCGKRWPLGPYRVGKDTKTLMGSGMFFLSAMVLIVVLIKLNGTTAATYKLAIGSVVIALVSTVTEAFSRRGYDNLTIPASVLISFTILKAVL